MSLRGSPARSRFFKHLARAEIGTALERAGPPMRTLTRLLIALLGLLLSDGAADVRGPQPAEPGPHRRALEPDPALREHPQWRALAATHGPDRAGDRRHDGARRVRLRVHEPQLSVGLRRDPIQGGRALGGRAHPSGHRGPRRQPHPVPPRSAGQARVLPLHRRLRGLRGPAGRAQAGRGPRGGGLRRQPGRHARPAQGPPRRGRRGQLPLPRPVRRARARRVPADLRVGRLPGPRGDRAPPGPRSHRGAHPPGAARHGDGPGRGARAEPREVQGLRARHRSRLRRRAPDLPAHRPVKSSLRALLLGLSTVAIVTVTLGGLAVNLRERSTATRMRLSEQTERLATAAAPLLLDSLVIGDLARAEQSLRNLNMDSVWSRVVLYESDGRRVIFDASPADVPRSEAPRWLKRLAPVTLPEHRIAIAAAPVVYGVLAVTPSVESLESELWAEVRTMIAVTGVLLVTLLGLTHVILLVGLRPVRALAESATRLGHGDLTARMPETTLAEMRPTV